MYRNHESHNVYYFHIMNRNEDVGNIAFGQDCELN